MNTVLLTVSGLIDPQVEEQVSRGERPEPDYLRMARVFEADLIDYALARRAGGRMGMLLEKIAGPNLLLAWVCFCLRGQYQVIFTDGEQVGIPLAFLLKLNVRSARPAHLMIAHLLSVGKKMALLDWLRLYSHIDTFFVYSTWQKRFIENRWKIPAERVIFTPFMVDTKFFSPVRSRPDDPLGLRPDVRPLICAVGLEFRDYPTLIEAVRDLDVKVIIAAASPWSKRPDTTQDQRIPNNVSVQRFSQYELRDVYAASRFLVMPLYPVNFQAGVTAILEAMAMGKAVVCSQVPGQTDVVLAGKTGVYVKPGNPNALKDAILELLNQPDLTNKLGQNGQNRVLEEMSLDCYVNRLNQYLKAVANS